MILPKTDIDRQNLPSCIHQKTQILYLQMNGCMNEGNRVFQPARMLKIKPEGIQRYLTSKQPSSEYS